MIASNTSKKTMEIKQREYTGRKDFNALIVNPSNCTKLDNLGILKQLYCLIYQCLERLELFELSNSQGLQKFTILEFWTKMSKSL